jgi:hypothetical protein
MIEETEHSNNIKKFDINSIVKGIHDDIVNSHNKKYASID